MNAKIDTSHVQLETKRLLLRPWQMTDLKDFNEYASQPGVGEMAGWSTHQSIEAVSYTHLHGYYDYISYTPYDKDEILKTPITYQNKETCLLYTSVDHDAYHILEITGLENKEFDDFIQQIMHVYEQSQNNESMKSLKHNC